MRRDKPGEGEKHRAEEQDRAAGVRAPGKGDGELGALGALATPALRGDLCDLCSKIRQVTWDRLDRDSGLTPWPSFSACSIVPMTLWRESRVAGVAPKVEG